MQVQIAQQNTDRAPCGVPSSVSRYCWSSITPVFSHRFTNVVRRGSATRRARNCSTYLWFKLLKKLLNRPRKSVDSLLDNDALQRRIRLQRIAPRMPSERVVCKILLLNLIQDSGDRLLEHSIDDSRHTGWAFLLFSRLRDVNPFDRRRFVALSVYLLD